MSTMASPLAVGGVRQSGAPVRTQNGKITYESQNLVILYPETSKWEFYVLSSHVDAIFHSYIDEYILICNRKPQEII